MKAITTVVGALLLAAAALGGAAEDLAKAIQGKWQLDMDAVVKLTDAYKKASPEDQAGMLESQRRVSAQPGVKPTVWEITADRITTSDSSTPTSYVVKKTEGRTVRLDTSWTYEGKSYSRPWSIEVVDGNTIHVDSGGAIQVLRRIKP
jgi:hypothetical protein